MLAKYLYFVGSITFLVVMTLLVNEPSALVTLFFILLILCFLFRIDSHYVLLYLLVACITTLYHYDLFTITGDIYGLAGDDYKFHIQIQNYAGIIDGQYEVTPFAIITYYTFGWIEQLLTGHISYTGVMFQCNLQFLMMVYFIIRYFACYDIHINATLLVFCLLLSPVVYDSTIHLYRDNFITLGVFMALYFFKKKSYSRSLIMLITITILRASNALIVCLYLVVSVLKKTSIIVVFGLTTIAVSSIYLPHIVKYGIMYGTDIVRMERRVNAFSTVDPIAVIEQRVALQKDKGNKIIAWAYSSNSVEKIFARPFLSFLLKLKYNDFYQEIETKSLGTYVGFWTSNLMTIILNTCRGILIFGALQGGVRLLIDRKQVNAVPSLLIFAVLVGLISGQPRHFLPFHVIVAAIATYGLAQKSSVSWVTYVGCLIWPIFVLKVSSIL